MDRSLVTPAWLAEHLDDPGVAVLDCTWYVPEAHLSGRALFEAGHVPGARFVDLDDVSDRTSPYLNMLPSPEVFAREIGRLGIGDDTLVVVYDANYVSARLWWMFRHFGHDAVVVLDGRLERWKNEGRPLERGPARPVAPAAFHVDRVADDVVGADEVLAALRSGSATVVDMRPPGKFAGTEPTGYPGVAPGGMPGAVNLPWARLFTADAERRFIDPDAFLAALQACGVDPERPIIATCGSGVTAAILAFHLTRSGHRAWKIYDGSWHEWGQRDDLPKEIRT